MKQLMTILAVVLTITAGPRTMADDTKSVDMARPSVVKTLPECGVSYVNPMTKEIRVTFSKEMMDGNWSWCTADEGEFPEMVGKPKYLADKRTCVLSVKLKPRTTYAMWLNSHRFINFKDRGGRPAVPYLLVFETR